MGRFDRHGGQQSSVLSLLADDCSVAIVWALRDGALSRSDLLSRMPTISRSSLTRGLGRLAELALVEREPYADGRRRVLYGLSGGGRELLEVIATMEAMEPWALGGGSRSVRIVLAKALIEPGNLMIVRALIEGSLDLAALGRMVPGLSDRAIRCCAR